MDSRRRQPLAPLEPDAFLAWAFRSERVKREPWETPLTLDDVVFEHRGAATRDELRRVYVRIAARVRRNQRLGVDPWEGI